MPVEKTYWFHAKRYGWGWGLPSAWQGWAVCLVYFSALYCIPAIRSLHHTGDKATHLLFLVIALTAAFIFVCWWKGEPAKWRSGSD